MNRAVTWCTQLITFCAMILGMLLVLALCWLVGKRAWNEVRGQVIQVQPILVQDAARTGLEPQLLANALAAEIDRILEAGNLTASRTAAVSLAPLPDIVLPAAGLSLASIDQLAHAVLQDFARTMSGEAVVSGGALRLTLHQVFHGRRQTVSVLGRAEGDGVREAVALAAEKLLYRTDPVIYAAYLYERCHAGREDAADAEGDADWDRGAARRRGGRAECQRPEERRQGERLTVLEILRAAEAGEDAAKTPQSRAQAATLQGLWCHENNDRDAAIEHYTRAIALAPGNAAIPYYHRGNARQEIANKLPAPEAKQKFEAAEQDFRKAVEQQRNNAFAWNSLGNALAALDRVPEAKRAYRQAIRLDPAYAQPHIGLGKLLLHAGEVSMARSEFGSAIALAPHDAALLDDIALQLRWSGQGGDAREMLAQAVLTHPGDRRFHDVAERSARWERSADDPEIAAGLRRHLAWARGSSTARRSQVETATRCGLLTPGQGRPAAICSRPEARRSLTRLAVR